MYLYITHIQSCSIKLIRIYLACVLVTADVVHSDQTLESYIINIYHQKIQYNNYIFLIIYIIIEKI